MGAGSMSMWKMFWSKPSYIRCSMLSWSASSELTGKYSSMRVMPLRFMFWVISTALVLHGVTISRRGPTNHPVSSWASRRSALPYSQLSSLVSSLVSCCSVCVAMMLPLAVLKKSIIIILLTLLYNNVYLNILCCPACSLATWRFLPLQR